MNISRKSIKVGNKKKMSVCSMTVVKEELLYTLFEAIYLIVINIPGVDGLKRAK